MLDPKFRSRQTYWFLSGLALVALGISVIVYGYLKLVPEVRGTYQHLGTRVQSITANTSEEIELKSILVSTVNAAEEGWGAYAEEKTYNAGLFFLVLGIFVIADHYRTKVYFQLIEKLRNS